MNETKRALDLHNKAVEAGRAAADACVPKPMVVVSEIGGKPAKEYFVSDGMCGFAWVRVPGNSWFIRAMKKLEMVGRLNQGGPRRAWQKNHYYAGYDYWVSYGNQSVARKEAFAKAMVEVFKAGGVEATWSSQLD